MSPPTNNTNNVNQTWALQQTTGGCLKRNHKGYYDFDKLYTVNSLFSRWIPVVVGISKTQKSNERMSDSDV
jgi:hypothetical protein